MSRSARLVFQIKNIYYMGSEMRLSVSSLLFNGSSVKVWLIYILDIFQTDNTFPYIMPKSSIYC